MSKEIKLEAKLFDAIEAIEKAIELLKTAPPFPETIEARAILCEAIGRKP